jgi:dihydrodipicolinate synthase/N-acetylneuraminate lyase
MILSTEKIIHPVSHIEYPAPLSGAAAPLFTPERADGRIDFEGLEAQADYLCRIDGVSSLIVRSGPGRMWSYSLSETRDAIRCVIAVAKNRKHVIANCAGIWDGNLANPPRPAVYRKQAADLCEWAVAQGAIAAMQPVPIGLQAGAEYPPQDVALRFFEDLASAISVPIIIYNQLDVPPGYALTPGTIQRLAYRPLIAGVIYNTTDLGLVGDLVRSCNPGFVIGTGNEAVSGPGWVAGASLSAGPFATLFPEIVRSGWHALQEADLHQTWRAQCDLLELHAALSPWTVWDIGCALMQRFGIAMAPRSRDGGRAPLPEEVDALMRLVQRIRLPYQ